MISMTELKSDFGLTNADSFEYILKSYISQNIFWTSSNLEGMLFQSEKDVHMIGEIYKTLQRAYPTDNILEKNVNYWNQYLKRTDVGIRRDVGASLTK
jgi:hypothetical protein